MSPDDLRQIEDALDVTLPDAYRRLMSPSPVRYLAGNADTDLWDNAEALIARNKALRGDRQYPWPTHWFFIGDPVGSDDANAIDLRDPSAPVFWVDQCDLRTVENVRGTRFDEWLFRWQTATRSDLAADSIDPDGDPPPPPKGRPVWVGKASITLLMVLVFASAVYGMIALVRAVWRALR
jgi:hypothetical protein